MLRVGHDRIEWKGRKAILDYSKVEYDSSFFADAAKYVPIEFDLCYLKTDKEIVVIGWWTGIEFYSAKLRKFRNYKIISWKRCND